ncbi:MAG: 3-deoxy-manno-octulosonate cytidylyltransferase [Bacteroidales bacterium]
MKHDNSTAITAIIPARFASTRFPGKPLELIGGKQMIHRVYEQASKAVSSVWVATDDERIKQAVEKFGGRVVMTSAEHRSGTDRCAEAASKIETETNSTIDIVINIQGDEPFIKPGQISLLVSCFNETGVKIATLVREVRKDEDLFNINHPKVVIASNGDALYFSRATIPFQRGIEKEHWLEHHRYFKHLGIYGYRKDVLFELTKLGPGQLENAESLEQNRWLENGYRIRTAVTEWESIGIDTPDDLEKANEFLKRHGDI